MALRHFIAIAVVFTAGQAAAQPFSAAARAALDGGKPFVEVRSSPDGASGVIRAAIDIAAPRDTVWQVMVDCSVATRLSRSLKGCTVLERDPQGRWDVRENVSRRTLLPPMRNVYRQDYDPPGRITFRRTAGDLEVFEGEWRLTQMGEKVRVTYEARVTAPVALPPWAARMALRHEVPLALVALRQESVNRAQAAKAYASARADGP